MADILEEIRERYTYAKNGWQDIRDEAARDMQFVAGDPWSKDDKDQRKNRPTVAPEEMGQYFNQVINQLLANPRGMRFMPNGNGATPEGARFYQNKARETEYRSHAKIAYIAAASNAIQRSYGFLRVATRYASPRSPNQEIWIEDFPDPDMVLPDPDAKRPDSSDMQYCFVLEWAEQSEFKRKRQPEVTNFGDFSASQPDWIQGTKVLQAEYWRINTRKRKLLLVELPSPVAGLMPLPGTPPPPAPKPLFLFKDELEAAQQQMHTQLVVKRELRDVDYPSVEMYLTDGLEILHEQKDWPGKYIPIVSCYGKVLYVPEGGQVKRKMLSMTRFGRDPWKSYCYACSQELEILAQVPKAAVLAVAGQLDNFTKDWEESPHVPKAYLLYNAKTAQTGDQILPPPQRLAYLQGENLQALEIVKEGFRRAIQSAMGSNFLPTQAQRRNEKSGVALDKMEKAASTGTFHFVDHYDDMIRRTAEIFEDLCDKVYDYQGETGVVAADGEASVVAINSPGVKDAIDTKGDYGVTVSTGPSSDSETEAAAEFTDTLVSKLDMIAGVSGPKVGAAVLARAIRMRNLGPQGDLLADLIEPPEFKAKDGKPPSPEVVAAQAEIQHLTQLLQQAAQEKEAKVVEQNGKFRIEQMKVEATSQDKAADREVKLAVAELGAKVDRVMLFMEERARLGVQAHESTENAKDRLHEHIQNVVDHQQALQVNDQAHGQALEQGEQAGSIAADAQARQQAADAAAAGAEA